MHPSPLLNILILAIFSSTAAISIASTSERWGVDGAPQILVTGGAGYIGSHTALVLLESGYEVTVVDSLVNSSPESLNRVANLTGLGHRLHFAALDIRDRQGLRALLTSMTLQGSDVEAVIHFAGLKAVGESVREPLLYYDANVASTLVLLEEMERFGSAGAHACDDDNDDNDGAKVGGGGGGGGDGGGGNDGVGSDDNAVGSSSSGGSDNESGVRSGGVKGRVRKKLIFSSSATVYGSSSSEKEAVPITEDSPTGGAGITNPYGRTKHVIEEMLGDLTRRPPSTPTATAAAAGTENKCNNKKGGDGDVEEEEEAWDVVVLRYFNPVGAHSSGLIGEDPSGPPNNLMPFVAQVAVGRRDELSVFGNDYDTPDGTGVRDFIHVMDLAEGHLAALGQLVVVAVSSSGRGGGGGGTGGSSSGGIKGGSKDNKSDGGGAGVEEDPEEKKSLKNKRTNNNGGGGRLHVFNLGSGVGYSVLEMVAAMEDACKCKVKYRVSPRRAGDLGTVFASTDKASAELGWEAKRSLKDMCTDLWRWQQGNPAGYPPGAQFFRRFEPPKNKDEKTKRAWGAVSSMKPDLGVMQRGLGRGWQVAKAKAHRLLISLLPGYFLPTVPLPPLTSVPAPVLSPPLPQTPLAQANEFRVMQRGLSRGWEAAAAQIHLLANHAAGYFTTGKGLHAGQEEAEGPDL